VKKTKIQYNILTADNNKNSQGSMCNEDKCLQATTINISGERAMDYRISFDQA